MDARHILAGRNRVFHVRDDLVQRQRRGVDHQGSRIRHRDDGGRHQRTGIEHDRRFLDQALAAHGDEFRIARPGADEMHDAHFVPTLAAPWSIFLA